MAVDCVRLQLDLHTFDPDAFVLYRRRCGQRGIDFKTLNEFGDDGARRRAPYELSRICAADIPARAAFYTFEDYLAQRIDTPRLRPGRRRPRRRHRPVGWHGHDVTTVTTTTRSAR